MKRVKRLSILFGLIIMSVLANEVQAQCPMCRGAVEGALKEEGNTKGLGLNKGILYLLATPYLAVAVVGGAWYLKKKRKS